MPSGETRCHVQNLISMLLLERIAAYHFAFMLNEDEEHRAGDFEDRRQTDYRVRVRTCARAIPAPMPARDPTRGESRAAR